MIIQIAVGILLGFVFIVVGALLVLCIMVYTNAIRNSIIRKKEKHNDDTPIEI